MRGFTKHAEVVTYLKRLTPPWEKARVIGRTGHIEKLGWRTTLRVSVGPVAQNWIATVLGTHKLTDVELSGFIIAQMKNWFGKVASTWQLLRGYYLTHAQPQQFPAALEPPQCPVRVRPGVYVCGDHRDNASIHGAMVSGRRAAESVLADFSR